jgi:hypothetical protein
VLFDSCTADSAFELQTLELALNHLFPVEVERDCSKDICEHEMTSCPACLAQDRVPGWIKLVMTSPDECALLDFLF